MSAAGRGLPLFSAFCAATFLAVYCLPAAWWVPLGLAVLIPAGFFLRRRLRAGVLLCLGAAAALLWCGCFRAVFFSPAEALDGRRCEVTAVVCEEPTATDYGALVPCWTLQSGRAPVKSTLYADAGLLDLRPGDRVTAVCDCTQTALAEETRFTTASTHGVFLTLKVRGDWSVEGADQPPWWSLPRWWGQQLAQSIRQVFPQDVSGLLAALVTGDKAGLPPGVRTDLARSGIVHLVAVSGMHVCFLVSFLTLLTGYHPRRRFWLCAPVVVLFALAVGATPSVLRACLFQLSFLLADLTGREEDRWTTLVAALALMLLLDPFCAGNVGLQMSFAAVAGITVVTPRVFTRLERCRFSAPGPWARRGNALLTRLWQTLAASLGAMVFTVPLAAYTFGSFSLVAPLTNLLVLPVASVLFIATLAVGLLGLVWAQGAVWLAWAVAWLGRYVLWVGRSLSALPYCALTLHGPYYPAVLTGLYALVTATLLPRRLPRRGRLAFLCGGVMLLGGIAATRWSYRAGTMTLAVLDVGQGQSVLLASQGQTALIDCGGNSDDDPGDVCADYLGDRGVDVLDTLILTHYHTDHVSGLDALFRRLDIREVVLPRMDRDEETQLHILDLARREKARVRWLEEDTLLSLGAARLQVFVPLGTGGANEEGASVLVRAGDFSALITGDMNAQVEELLVDHADLGPCPVLVAGHHGSDSASGETLLSALRPRTVLISVGENSYGHPGTETLERLERYGAEVYRTDRAGTLTLKVP